jgi:hypothetical protein
MSKRLQVVVDEQEWDEIQAVARLHGKTPSEWARQVLRAARRPEAAGSVEAKLAVVRTAAAREGPTADIEQMLAEIERGYLGSP